MNYNKLIFTIRQLLGAITSIGIWWLDVEHKLTQHTFPLIIYILPIGIAMGWDIQKLLAVFSKGTKFEKIFNEEEEKIKIESDILAIAVKNDISKHTIENAIKSGLSHDDLLKLLKENPMNVKKQFWSKE
jgi:hypothetical protein